MQALQKWRAERRAFGRAPGALRVAAFWGLFSCACEGPGVGVSPSGNAGADAAAGGGSGVAGAPATLPADAPHPPATGRRLTNAEYLRSASQIFGQDFTDQVARLPEDQAPRGFRNDLGALLPSAARTFAIEEVAWFIADGVAWSTLSSFAPCAESSSACQQGFVANVGRRLFRRPLTPVEVGRWAGMFATSAAEGEGFERGARLVVAGLLQSPHFQYRLERLDGARDAAGRALVSDYELATRLSFLLWGTAPDAALLDEAERGALQAGPAAALERLLVDAGTPVGLTAFVDEWLSLYRLDTMYRSPEAFPELVPALPPVLKRELHALFEPIALTQARD
jgi:hypothetical protein